MYCFTQKSTYKFFNTHANIKFDKERNTEETSAGSRNLILLS
jgi:hypothetical protein